MSLTQARESPVRSTLKYHGWHTMAGLYFKGMTGSVLTLTSSAQLAAGVYVDIANLGRVLGTAQNEKGGKTFSQYAKRTAASHNHVYETSAQAAAGGDAATGTGYGALAADTLELKGSTCSYARNKGLSFGTSGIAWKEAMTMLDYTQAGIFVEDNRSNSDSLEDACDTWRIQ